MLNKTIKSLLIIILFSAFSCSYGSKSENKKSKVIQKNLSTNLQQSSQKNFILTKNNGNNSGNESNSSLDDVFGGMFVPEMSKMLSFPKPPEFTQGNQIISFSVTQNVDLKDVLIELSRVAGLEIDIDPKISGGIIINAKNRPLIEVIKRICNLGNIRYDFKNGVLTFYSDYNYSKHYLVNYLVEGGLWTDVETNLKNIISGLGVSDGSVILNKSAGIITIFANEKGQNAAKQYLDEVKKIASAQVLIEAKVIEVTLSDKYQAGIDWSLLGSDGKGAEVFKKSSVFDSDNPAAATFNVVSSSVFGSKGELNISALQEFGNVKAISSPRVSTLHNQKAKLDFVEKFIYFTVETNVTNSFGDNPTETSNQSATKNEELIGVELSITPSIDLAKNEITLGINPKLSIKSGEAEDPLVAENKIPIINTREIQTFAKIRSGDTLVLGGLMKEGVNNEETAVPFLSKIPFLGNLFKYVSKEKETVETVIFIKATIIDSAYGLDRNDRKFYNKYAN
ncbi:hypothetical protein N9O56_02460 [Rickettsiales bacterium]|nr:hypothetical protein [Rickettsiales bacterium]